MKLLRILLAVVTLTTPLFTASSAQATSPSYAKARVTDEQLDLIVNSDGVAALPTRLQFGNGVFLFATHPASQRGPEPSNGVERWRIGSAMTTSRSHVGLVIVNGYAYAIGGDDSYGNVTASVEWATVVTPTCALADWTPVASLSTPRTRAAVVADGNHIYVIGGSDENGPLATVEWTTVQPDGSLSGWTAGSPLNEAREGATAVIANGYVYVIGGRLADGTVTASVERAPINPDGSLGAWVTDRPLSTPRADAAAAYGADYIYVLGGTAGYGPLNTVEKTRVLDDGSLDAWATTTAMLYPRQELAALQYEGYLFAFGGRSLRDITLSEVEFAPIFLDGSGDLGPWLPTASMVNDRAGLGVAAYNEWVYAIGGEGGLGALSTTEWGRIRGRIVVPPPRIYQVQPPGGPNTTPVLITVYGRNFIDRPRVQLGGWPLDDVNYVDAGTLTAVVPTGLAPGAYDLMVINPDGQTAIFEDAYTVLEGGDEIGPAPSLDSLSPTSADNSVDVSLLLTGTNFVSPTQVFLGDISLTQVTYVSSTTLEALVPQGTPPGVYDVRVVNPDGQMASLPAAFTLSAGNGVWRLRRGRMTPRYNGGGVVLDELLYAVSGADGYGFGRLNEAYDPVSDTWSRKMDHPGVGGRLLPGIVALNGRLYTFGGQDLAHGVATTAAYVYDPDSGIWSPLTDYPLHAYGLAAAAEGGMIYLFGGEQPSPTGSGPGTQYRNVYVYAPSSDTYTPRSDLPVAVSRAVALAYGGKIYVIGGLRAGTAYDGVQVYDPATDEWTTAASLPQPRAEAVGVVLNGRLYVIGGHDGQRVQRTVYEYDPAADTWRERTPLTTPRAGAFGGVIGGKIYVAGGRSSLQAALPLDSVEEGDFGEAPPQPRLYVSAVSHDFGEVETTWEFDIANLGDGTLTWSVTESPEVNWLTVDPASGSGSATIQVSVSRDGLAAGRYTTNLVVSSNGGQATIHIEMTVEASPLLQVLPTALVFNVGETSKTIHIANLGGGTLTWNISADDAWVQLSRQSGSSDADVTVTVDRSSLSSGENTTSLHITSNGGDATVTIRVFKEDPPALAVSPSLLDFGTDRVVLPFEVHNTGGGILSWQAWADQPWLTLSRTSGQNDGTVQVSVVREGLSPGQYSATITVSGAGQQATITVRMTVQAPPKLSVSPTLLDLGSTANEATFVVRNDGGGVLRWDVYEDVDWLWVNPTQGENNTTVTVHVNRSAQTPGQKIGIVEVRSAYGTVQVEVRMTVEQGPLLRVSPTYIDLGTQSTSAQFHIQNAGGGTLTWNISNIPSWLSLSRTSGSGEAWIQVTALRDQMAPGNYSAQLLVQGGDQAGQQTVNVVAVQEASPQLEVSPTRLDFGTTIDVQSITVRNTGGGTLNWQATDNRSWITLSPTAGTNDGSIRVYVNRSGLSPGHYTGQVTVQGAGQSVQVEVIMDVEPPQITHLTVGNVTVYADNFEWLGGNKYKATGNVRFNSRVRLSGSGDYCIVDQDRGEIYGKGTVALETTRGRVDIFRDSFSVSPYAGTIHPDTTALFNLLLDEIATFEVIDTIDLSVDAINNRVNGVVTLDTGLPDNDLRATVTWEMDYQGRFSGSVSDLSLQVSGLTLKAERISLSNEGLRVSRAHLEFPSSLGRVRSSAVYDLVITGHAPYLELDSVFTVERIPFGGSTGFEIQHARLEISYRNGQFRLVGEGKFIFKKFYQYGQCALDINFEIYSLDRWSGAFAISCTKGVPIGSTGFFITDVRGGVSFGQSNFAISLGVTIVGGPYVPSIDEYALSGDSVLFFKSRSGGLALGLKGNVRILKWNIAYAELEFRRQGDWAGVRGEIQINLTVVNGEASVSLWRDSTGAHFQGNGNVKVVIPRCFIVNTWLLCIPPSDWTIAEVDASVGEFSRTSTGQKVYGLKGTVKILEYDCCFFVDAEMNLGKCSELLDATVFVKEQHSNVEGTVDSIKRNVEITLTHPVLFALGWNSGSPHLRLIDPTGKVIEEDTRASGIQTMRTVTQSLISVSKPVTGIWTVEIYDLLDVENYELLVLQDNAPPVVVIKAPSALAEEGTYGYQIQWEVSDPDSSNVTVNLFYGPSPNGPWLPIATQLSMGITSYLWDTSAVPEGEYFVYIEANDGINPPQGVLSAGTVRVENRDAPPAPAPISLTVDPEHRSCLVQWSPVSAPDLEGYRVYYGYASGSYEYIVDAGNSTSVELLGLEEGQTLYVAVTAYDVSGNESPFSQELSKRIGMYSLFLPLVLR